MFGIVICPVVFYLPKFGELRTTDVYGSVIVKLDCASVGDSENATNFQGKPMVTKGTMLRRRRGKG